MRNLTMIAVAIVAALGCSTDRLLQADRPDLINPGNLGNLQGAAALYAGALGDFAVAHDGGNGGGAGIGLVIATGFMSDEFRFGGTPPEIREMDLRSVREANGAWLQTYIDQHRARGAADRAAEALKGAVTGPDARIGEMYAVAAAEIILIGEAYCSGAPLGAIEPDLLYGEPLTTQQLMTAAIAKLDLAAQNAAGNARIVSLIAVLRGRALLNNAQFAAAAAAVASVPTSFSYVTLHSSKTERQKLFPFNYMYNADSWLVSDREGVNGLNFATAADPRVPIDGDGSPSRFDQRTPRYYLRKYNSFDSPVTVASGAEARLIEAEAALQAANTTLWLTKLTDARLPGMAALTDPGTAAARVDLMFRERAFALFGTAHRLGDLRRLIRQYSRGAETVFPTGAYHKDNLTRGTDVNISLPISEKNNPKFTGCLNRGA